MHFIKMLLKTMQIILIINFVNEGLWLDWHSLNESELICTLQISAPMEP